MKRIGILLGSESDLAQCVEGNAYLLKQVEEGNAIVCGVHAASQHRRALTVQSILFEYSRAPENERIDVLITAAGWANHLSGCSDAFLRFALQDDHIVVIAVAIEDLNNEARTLVACLSSSEVPGHQMMNTDDEGNPLKGNKGYLWACQTAVTSILPRVIAKTPPAYKPLKLQEAYDVGITKNLKS